MTLECSRRIVATQYRDRPSLQRVFGQVSKNPPGHVCTRSVEHKFPVLILRAGAETERDAFVVCIEQDKERVANDALALRVGFIDLTTEQAHTKAADISGIPVLV